MLKIILYKQWRRSKKYAEIIRNRGPEKYRDYTPEMIFNNVLQAYKQTAKLLWPKVWKFWRLWLVPKIYFEEKIDPMVARFPIYKSEFEKIGRNEFICVKMKNGRIIAIKKKQFISGSMQFLKPCGKTNKP